MTRFPTRQHLIAWACLCRRLDESAGKRKSTRTRKGVCWLKTVLVQAAWAAVRTKNSYYRAQFLRLRARRRPEKAIVAVAASMLTAIYYILRDSAEYRELGGQYFERLDRTKATQRLVKRLRDLGYRVQMDSIVRIFLGIGRGERIRTRLRLWRGRLSDPRSRTEGTQ
jgi:transposase